jgi:hypothetical protein
MQIEIDAFPDRFINVYFFLAIEKLLKVVAKPLMT